MIKKFSSANNFRMKKLLIVATLFIILINANDVKPFSLLDYFEGEYYAYTESRLSSDSINLGMCYMTESAVSIKDVVGESIKVYNFEPISALDELNARLIKTEQVEGATIFYAYSHLVDRSVNVFGTKCNIQIAYYDDYSIIGWPMILGSF